MPTTRILFLLLSAAVAHAQDYYYGSVGDVFPVALATDADGAARLWVGQVAEPIALTRAPGSGGGSTWRARDTALVLRARLAGDTLVGVLRDGGGHERSVLAQAYTAARERLPVAPSARASDPAEWVRQLRGRIRLGPRDTTPPPRSAAAFPADFLTACGSDKWVRAYVSAGDAYRLTLAKLPGGRLRGSLHVAATATTLLVDGAATPRGAALSLTRVSGAPAGALAIAAETAADGAAAGGMGVRLSAKLTLGDAPRDLRLSLTESLALDCRQSGGRWDLLLPADGGSPATPPPLPLVQAAPRTLAEFADRRWGELLDAGGRGSGWFEPHRLDADVLSGLVHLRAGDYRRTYALNLDRRSGRLIPARRLAAGPKRDRAAGAAYRTAAVEASHPLRHDADFRAWLASAPLTHVVVLGEGLAYATDRHPVYGTAAWVTPWGEVGDRARAFE